jgi:hypothetical protein
MLVSEQVMGDLQVGVLSRPESGAVEAKDITESTESLLEHHRLHLDISANEENPYEL